MLCNTNIIHICQCKADAAFLIVGLKSSENIHGKALPEALFILSINNKSSRYYQLEKHTLQEVQDNPYLGLQISYDLKWSIHINNVCKKAYATLGFLRRNLRNVPETCRNTTYVTLVRSIMEYGATIWNPYLKEDIDRLERIQNRAISFAKKRLQK